MIEINLLAWRQNARVRAKQRYLFAMMLMIALGLSVVTLMHMWMSVKIAKQVARNHYLTQTIAMKDHQIKLLKHQNQELAPITASIHQLKTIPESKRRLSGFLAELSHIEASKVVLTKINLDQNTIVFSGRAPSRQAVSVLVKNINQSDWMESPEIREMMEEHGDQHEQDFELIATIKDVYGKRG